MKSAIVWSAVVLIIIGAVFGIAKLAKAPSDGQSGSIPEVSAQDQTRGPKDAKVVLVEYSDFQCPACGAFFPHVEELDKELGGKLLFVYRHFPLPQHKNAEITAYAAEVAGRQGKFWEMYRLIFENQNEWSESGGAEEFLGKYAESLGLNLDQFKKDLDSSDIRDKVSADARGGMHAGINSTPTFYLNGKKLSGYQSFDDFKRLIRDAVEADANQTNS